MLSTIIAGLALGTIVFFSVRYIVKQKRKGVKCIGCPVADSCGTQNAALAGAHKTLSVSVYSHGKQVNPGECACCHGQ